MPLNNTAAADALLKLFNINMSWEELEKLDPQLEPERSAMMFVKAVDDDRAGDLFTSEPDMKLLVDAYHAGYRLVMAGPYHHHAGFTGHSVPLKLIHPDGTMLDFSTFDAFGGPNAYDLWKRMYELVNGHPTPQKVYNLQVLGETILHQISRERAEHAATRKFDEYFKPKAEIGKGYGIKSLGFDRVNMHKIALLNMLLQSSLHESGCDKEVIKLKVFESHIIGGKSYLIDGIFYDRNTDTSRLSVILTAPNPSRLANIDFIKVLEKFREKTAVMTPAQLDMSPLSSDPPSKVKFFTRYCFDEKGRGVSIPGKITPERMKVLAAGAEQSIKAKKNNT